MRQGAPRRRAGFSRSGGLPDAAGTGTGAYLLITSNRRVARIARGDKKGSTAPNAFGAVPSPDASGPDGRERTFYSIEIGPVAKWLSAVPVGESPTGAGGSPALPFRGRRSSAGA